MKLYTEHLTVNYGKDKVKLEVHFEDGDYPGYYLRAYLKTSPDRSNFRLHKLLMVEVHTIDDLDKAVTRLQQDKQFIINILLAPYEQAR